MLAAKVVMAVTILNLSFLTFELSFNVLKALFG
jgi:hypothetical protein